MKKTHIFLSAMLLMVAFSNSYGQWTTGTGGVFTPNKVGIGMASVPTNAALRIEGVTATGSCTGFFGPTHVPYFPNPELWIDRTVSSSSAGCSVPSANFFQVTTFDPTGFPGITRTLDVINPSGYMGILQPKPTQPLDVAGNALVEKDLVVGSTVAPTTIDRLMVMNGNISMPNTADNTVRYITCRSSKGMLYMGTDFNMTTGVTNGPSIEMGAMNNSWRPGQVYYYAYAGAGNPSHIFLNNDPSNAGTIETMLVDAGTPKVVIGNVSYNTATKYSLYVQNGILTEKLKVATPGGTYWSDFVFNKNYTLMPLGEVEQYVTTNKHLPDVPSASEVEKDGIDVANMDAKLLQKIEELTLYVIQQQKEIELLKKRMN